MIKCSILPKRDRDGRRTHEHVECSYCNPPLASKCCPVLFSAVMESMRRRLGPGPTTEDDKGEKDVL